MFKKHLWAIALLSLTGIPSAYAADILSVSGTKLLLNGAPLEVHGVQIDGLAAPIQWLQVGRDGAPLAAYLAAYNHFDTQGAAELRNAQKFGANTIEFKVSQPATDPQNALYSQDYINKVASAVQLARSMGFVVIATQQDTWVSGEPTRAKGLTTEGSLRSALTMAAMFKGDRGVMIELYTEPFGNWTQYVNGGNGYVGVNQIIQQMRAAGAQNLIAVEPLIQSFSMYEKYLERQPTGAIADVVPNELIYTIHPYFDFKQVGSTPQEWGEAFGGFAATHPVLVTEWSEMATKVGPDPKWCEKGAPLTTPLVFLHYLKDHQINGVVGWSFDVNGTIAKNYGETPTTMDGAVCDQVPGGVGVWLEDYFRGALPPV